MNSIKDVVKAEFQIDVDNLVGTNIDSFHKDPAHQRKLLSSLKGSHQAEISFGGLVLDLNIAPVVSEDGDTQGYVVNWEEISEKNELKSSRLVHNK